MIARHMSGQILEAATQYPVVAVTGPLLTGRVLTAPAGLVPEVVIRKGNESEVRPLSADDAFKKSISRFRVYMEQDETRLAQYRLIERQAELIEEFVRLR